MKTMQLLVLCSLNLTHLDILKGQYQGIRVNVKEKEVKDISEKIYIKPNQEQPFHFQRVRTFIHG